MIYLTQADLDSEKELMKEEAYRRNVIEKLDKKRIKYFYNAPIWELEKKLYEQIQTTTKKNKGQKE